MAKPLVDYKFWYVRRDDDIHISEAAIRFYEGEESAQLETDTDGVEQMVTRYRRSKKLQGAELPADKPKKKDKTGAETVIYTASDFGVISTDEELRAYLNQELKKFVGKSPVKEQL